MGGGLLNLQVLGSAKQNVLYYFLHSRVAVSKRFDLLMHTLNLKNGKGPHNPIRIVKYYGIQLGRLGGQLFRSNICSNTPLHI